MSSILMPVTESQLGLLAATGTAGVPHLYNILAEIELDPRYPPPAVADALTAVLAVQPALRLAMSTGIGRRAELIDPPSAQGFLDQQAVPAAELDARRAGALAELAALPVIEMAPPALRARHLRAGDGTRSLLLMVVHHTVFDGYSLRPLVDDLNAALRGDLGEHDMLRAEREDALRAELDAQARAGSSAQAAAQARELASRVVAQPAAALCQGAGSDRCRAGVLSLAMPPAQSAAVDKLCATLRVSAYTVFSAVFGALLAWHCGYRSVRFGVPLAARCTTRSFGLCGSFVNTLPMLLEVPWSAPFAEFVTGQVAAELVGTMASRAVPLSALARETRAASREESPAFWASLSAQEEIRVAEPAPVLAARLRGGAAARAELTVYLMRTGGGWVLDFEYDRDLLTRQAVSGMAESMRGALLRAASAPGLLMERLFAAAPCRDG